MLTVMDSLPDGLLEHDASRLHRILKGPTLIHLQGRRPEPLFVSVLLHGNELTGWEAMRALLARYRKRALPRSLSLLIGNIAAAHGGVRCLDGQPDFNRVWRGSGSPEHEMAAQVLEDLEDRRVFASVDVHNTSGRNPHYACVCVLDPRNLYLAHLFSRLVVYFTQPDSVQTRAFSELCPAVTVECGQPGEVSGTTHALDYLEACLNLEEVPARAPKENAVDLFHSVAVVRVPAGISIGVHRDNADLCLAEGLDCLNFQELPAGTAVGRVRSGADIRLQAFDESGAEVGDLYFARRDAEIVTAAPFMPAMLTLDERIIRQDCLCYIMERYSQ